MKKSTLFDVKELIPIQDLCADGTIPYSSSNTLDDEETTERLTRDGEENRVS